jgi:hypothetical protein
VKRGKSKHRPRSEPPRAAEPAINARAVRHFLVQAAELEGWDAAYIREMLGVGADTAAEVVSALALAGYVEAAEKGHWRNTPEGNRVAGVSSAPPIKRATLQKNLEAFLTRVQEVNSGDRFPFRVEEAVLFGPFLSSKADRVKNAAVAVRLTPKQPGAANEAEVRAYLKGRSRSISLFPLEDWVLRQPHQVVFEEQA